MSNASKEWEHLVRTRRACALWSANSNSPISWCKTPPCSSFDGSSERKGPRAPLNGRSRPRFVLVRTFSGTKGHESGAETSPGFQLSPRSRKRLSFPLFFPYLTLTGKLAFPGGEAFSAPLEGLSGSRRVALKSLSGPTVGDKLPYRCNNHIPLDANDASGRCQLEDGGGSESDSRESGRPR